MSTVNNRSKIQRCTRCSKRYRGHGEWNIDWVVGYQVGMICPDCQTVEEDLEAELKMITGETSDLRLVHVSDMTHDECVDYIHQMINKYPTFEAMRAAADKLWAARPDCREGPVALMRRIADDMESGELYEDDDTPRLTEHVQETVRRAIAKGKGVYVARDENGNIVDARIQDDDAS